VLADGIRKKKRKKISTLLKKTRAGSAGIALVWSREQVQEYNPGLMLEVLLRNKQDANVVYHSRGLLLVSMMQVADSTAIGMSFHPNHSRDD
jgi:hypothetical protein